MHPSTASYETLQASNPNQITLHDCFSSAMHDRMHWTTPKTPLHEPDDLVSEPEPNLARPPPSEPDSGPCSSSHITLTRPQSSPAWTWTTYVRDCLPHYLPKVLILTSCRSGQRVRPRRVGRRTRTVQKCCPPRRTRAEEAVQEYGGADGRRKGQGETESLWGADHFVW